MRTKAFLVPLLSFLCWPSAFGQDKVPQLLVSGKGVVRYPSLEPIVTIDMLLAGIFDVVKQAIKNSPWNCTSAKFYSVEIVDKGKSIGNVPIIDAIAQGNDPTTGKRFTQCDAYGNNEAVPSTVSLAIAPRVPANAKLRVTLFGDAEHKVILAQSDGSLTLTSAENITFTATPQSAPGEALNNGQKRDVGQLSVSFAHADLMANRLLNLYAKSSDIFSTDSKDSKSAFSALLGIRRGLFRSWYTPWQLEQSVQGNQTASNLSTVTNLGLTTLLPWKWSRPVFNNQVIAAPLPPDITISNQYTHRINQLVSQKTPLLAVNDYSLNPSLNWSSITLPASCKVLGWLNRANTPYCIGTELNLGMWYLPLNLTKRGTQRAEGYGDISILAPLAGFNFASAIFPYVISSDATKVQIRVKYSDSVNSANNYARTRVWTYGLEVLK